MNKIIIGFTVLILVVVAIGFNLEKSTRNETIKIGVVYALTGPAATWSENGLKAAQIAVEEINAAGGINGRNVELVVEDSGTDAKDAVSSFQKLTTIDKVDVVVGDVWSFLTNPLVPLAESSKTVLISPTVMNSSVETQSEYFFTLGHRVESQEAAIKKFFTSNPDIKSVYNLCWNDAWSKAHTALFKKVAAELSINVIGETCTHDFTSTYQIEATKVKAAAPDAVFLTSVLEENAIRALVDLKVTTKILTTTGVVEAVRIRNLPHEYTKNVWFMDWAPDDAFVAKFKNKYGTYPIMEAQNHYEVIRSIAKGLENKPNDLMAGLKTVKYESTDEVIDFVNSDNITPNKAEAKLYTINLDGSFVEVK